MKVAIVFGSILLLTTASAHSGKKCKTVRCGGFCKPSRGKNSQCLACLCHPRCVVPRCGSNCVMDYSGVLSMCPSCMCSGETNMVVVAESHDDSNAKHALRSHCVPLRCGGFCKPALKPDGCITCRCHEMCRLPSCSPNCRIDFSGQTSMCPSCKCDVKKRKKTKKSCAAVHCGGFCQPLPRKTTCPSCLCHPVCPVPSCAPNCFVDYSGYRRMCPYCVCPVANETDFDITDKSFEPIFAHRKTSNNKQHESLAAYLDANAQVHSETLSESNDSMENDDSYVEKMFELPSTNSNIMSSEQRSSVSKTTVKDDMPEYLKDFIKGIVDEKVKTSSSPPPPPVSSSTVTVTMIQTTESTTNMPTTATTTTTTRTTSSTPTSTTGTTTTTTTKTTLPTTTTTHETTTTLPTTTITSTVPTSSTAKKKLVNTTIGEMNTEDDVTSQSLIQDYKTPLPKYIRGFIDKIFGKYPFMPSK